MCRYKTQEWLDLVSLQNKIPSQDILIITAFMDDEEFIVHLARYKELLGE